MAQPKIPTSKWVCGKCNKIEKQPTYIKEMAHKCKMNQGKMTQFQKAD